MAIQGQLLNNESPRSFAAVDLSGSDWDAATDWLGHRPIGLIVSGEGIVEWVGWDDTDAQAMQAFFHRGQWHPMSFRKILAANTTATGIVVAA